MKNLTLATVVALVVSSSVALAQNGGDETVIKPPVRGSQQQQQQQRDSETPKRLTAADVFGDKSIWPGILVDTENVEDSPDKGQLATALKMKILNRLADHGINTVGRGSYQARTTLGGMFGDDSHRGDPDGLPDPNYVLGIHLMLTQNTATGDDSRHFGNYSRSESGSYVNLMFDASVNIQTVTGRGIPGWGLASQRAYVHYKKGEQVDVSMGNSGYSHGYNTQGRTQGSIDDQLDALAERIVNDLIRKVETSRS